MKIEKEYRQELSPEKRAFIWGLFQGGQSGRSIATKLSLPKSTISNTIALVRENLAAGAQNPFKSRPRSGRPNLLATRACRALIRHACHHRFDTLQALATPSKSGQQISRYTVRKTLKAVGRFRRKARKKPFISKVNKKKRLEFCKANKNIL